MTDTRIGIRFADLAAMSLDDAINAHAVLDALDAAEARQTTRLPR